MPVLSVHSTVSGTEIVDRRQALHDHLLLRHAQGTARQRDRRDHRQQLGRQPDGERHRRTSADSSTGLPNSTCVVEHDHDEGDGEPSGQRGRRHAGRAERATAPALPPSADAAAPKGRRARCRRPARRASPVCATAPRNRAFEASAALPGGHRAGPLFRPDRVRRSAPLRWR